ncbi:MAG: NAD(P)-binding domain-containing protein, partial [Rhodothermales bacterium]|nr:NAD(P)-binding domain-containing protein [Rhodothermales bacterium]
MSETGFRLDAFSIAGTGAVGTAFARALLAIGCRLDFVVSRRRARAEAFRDAIARTGSVTSITDPALARSELLILAVPDDALPSVAEDLASSGADWSGSVVLHVSGALDSSLLEPVARLGAATGSFHPIQTFTASSTGPQVFEGITVGIEGSPRALEAAHALADGLLCRAVELD